MNSQEETQHLISQTQTRVRINEVRPNPLEGEHEFVELFVPVEGSFIYLPLIFSESESRVVLEIQCSFVRGQCPHSYYQGQPGRLADQR